MGKKTRAASPFGPAWVGWESYGNFVQSVTSNLRYVRTKPSEQFLDSVRTPCPTRKLSIAQNTTYWRARLGCEFEEVKTEDDEITIIYDEERPYKPAGMKPIPNWQGEGRANPRGIPSLYIATSADTALAEIRPWIGATITVARLQLERDLTVIDCSKFQSKWGGFLSIIGDKTKSLEDGIWTAIDRAFATPVSKEDESKDYIPTQILAELFKSEGYDGIVYKSLLSPDGLNLALFNLNDAKVVHCELYKLDSISFSASRTGTATFFG